MEIKNEALQEEAKRKKLLEILAKENLSVLEVFSLLPVEESLKDICKLTPEDRVIYSQLFQELKRIHDKRRNCTDQEKGKVLENIVKFVLAKSGGLFEVKSNLHTSTNEIDDLVILNKKGARLVEQGLMDFKGPYFICECKNYNDKVDVTFVGKFCSLVMSQNCRLGIMFSYYGLSGSGWNDGIGITKKFHLRKEKPEERYYIIEFNKDDFELIEQGHNFLEIYESKVMALETDTKYEHYLQPHPAMDSRA